MNSWFSALELPLLNVHMQVSWQLPQWWHISILCDDTFTTMMTQASISVLAWMTWPQKRALCISREKMYEASQHPDAKWTSRLFCVLSDLIKDLKRCANKPVVCTVQRPARCCFPVTWAWLSVCEWRKHLAVMAAAVNHMCLESEGYIWHSHKVCD